MSYSRIAFNVTFISILLQVIIQGFKSYREQTVIDPFHKGHNVVGELAKPLSLSPNDEWKEWKKHYFN